MDAEKFIRLNITKTKNLSLFLTLRTTQKVQDYIQTFTIIKII